MAELIELAFVTTAP